MQSTMTQLAGVVNNFDNINKIEKRASNNVYGQNGQYEDPSPNSNYSINSKRKLVRPGGTQRHLSNNDLNLVRSKEER